MNNPQIVNAAALIGRILMSAIFISAGYNKIGGYANTSAYMANMGVPAALLPLVIITELGGGLLILLGYQTRIVAFLLAGFSILAGVIFHYSVGDVPNMISFWKNVAIAGGFLGMVAHGAGAWSLDGRLGKK
ncbi:MAG: DoxX family protein [Rhodoblastus sp.]